MLISLIVIQTLIYVFIFLGKSNRLQKIKNKDFSNYLELLIY